MDNYSEFIARLDAASARLGARRESMSKTVEILRLLHEQNHTGFELWEQRRMRAEELLARHSGKPEAYNAVSELHNVALKMERMFRNRTQRIGGRLTAIKARRDQIDCSLLELGRSKLKLESSRVLSEEHANLSKAVASLAGTPEGPAGATPDTRLRADLNDAREAIILAEALLEAKGM